MSNVRVWLAVVAAGVVVGACGAGPSSSPTTSSAPAPEWGSVTGVVATTRGELAVYGAGDESVSYRLPAETEFGSPTTLRVLATHPGRWLEVAVPVRPNGSRGFVRASDVDLARVEYSIDVDLAAKRLWLNDAEGEVVLETAIAIGSPENPTPTGEFFVTDVLDTGAEGSAYGPFALGLSAHSDTLSEFGGGDGQIGIHGTNRPASIGNAVSHGCIRVPNEIVVRLADSLPLGTPVSIR